MSTYILESERLLFRNIEAEDCEEMFLLNADWEVIKYTGDVAFNTLAEARDFYEKYQTEVYEKTGYGRMITILKDTNEVIGWCGLKYHPEEAEVDLGFRFHKRFWNQGYATEASIACLNHGYRQHGLTTIKAFAMKENLGSCRVLEKVGFQYQSLVHRYNKFWKMYELVLPLNADGSPH